MGVIGKMLWIAAFVALISVPACAQRPAAGAPSSLVGNWQGALMFGSNAFRIGLVVTKDASGTYSATLVNIEQGGNIPVEHVTFSGGALHFDLPTMRGTYDGTLDPAGRQITGTLTQNMPQPLTFERVDKLDPAPAFDATAAAEVTALINTYFHAFTVGDWDHLPLLSAGSVDRRRRPQHQRHQLA